VWRSDWSHSAVKLLKQEGRESRRSGAGVHFYFLSWAGGIPSEVTDDYTHTGPSREGGKEGQRRRKDIETGEM